MSATLTKQKTLMVMAGGTGGHVYPAIAVADYLITQGWQVIWLCTQGGMENRLIINKPYATGMITMQGVRGKGLSRWLLLPLHLAKAFKEAYQVIQESKPNLVLGMGGYAAFPGGVMAKLLGKPLVIHEQNSIAGLTNKLLSRIANKTLSAFPKAFKSAEVVGNPVRIEMTQVANPQTRFLDRTGPLRILVVGGSLGAQVLNDVLPRAFAKLPENTRPTIIHQAGEKHIDALKRHYAALKVQADAIAFIENMVEMYAWADMVICRAGALTVAELSAVGVASVLVPFPFAVDDHQTYNAHYLSNHGAAILIPQPEFTLEKLNYFLQTLTRAQCLDMAIKARKLGQPEATVKVGTICMEQAG
jgi:UDP-N-acetylglucosamine--N-acetylmuramyl-(pentapeptide) pyrophosphoryl-undecaprenol N-acetylglucosamine transferase